MNTYLVPVLSYGLEFIFANRMEMETLEVEYRKMLRQVLSLPDRCADAVVYIIAGIAPLKAHIHSKALSLLGMIASPQDSIEKDLAYRQSL